MNLFPDNYEFIYSDNGEYIYSDNGELIDCWQTNTYRTKGIYH